MRILSIESSCDETGASVVEMVDGKVKVLSNILATSSQMHALTGGVIPENAAREQVKVIIPVIVKALLDSNSEIQKFNSFDDKNVEQLLSEESFRKSNIILSDTIDAIAVTYGPGLIGSLIIGVETAKTLSYALNKPIVPVNHLLAHIYANFISPSHFSLLPSPFPFIGLIVSGGHTDLLYFESHEKYKWLGGTRDDAAGEAIDKIGRMLDLPYPAGPEMEKRTNEFRSQISNPRSVIKFTSPLLNSTDYDFSFSGLKAEAMRFIKANEITDNLKNEVCHAVQRAVFDVLVKKSLRAAEEYNCSSIVLGGGVSANQTLLEEFQLNAKRSTINAKIFSPEKIYSTDNAAMIGTYALLAGKQTGWEKVKSNPELYFA